MKKLSVQTEKRMIEHFGKDTVIALATVEDEIPYARHLLKAKLFFGITN